MFLIRKRWSSISESRTDEYGVSSEGSPSKEGRSRNFSLSQAVGLRSSGRFGRERRNTFDIPNPAAHVAPAARPVSLPITNAGHQPLPQSSPPLTPKPPAPPSPLRDWLIQHASTKSRAWEQQLRNATSSASTWWERGVVGAALEPSAKRAILEWAAETDHHYYTPKVEKATNVDFAGVDNASEGPVESAGADSAAAPGEGEGPAEDAGADTDTAAAAAAAAVILADPISELPKEALAQFPAAAVFGSLAPQILKHFGLDIVKEPSLEYHVAGAITPRTASTIATTPPTVTTMPLPTSIPAPPPPRGVPTVADAVAAADAEVKSATLEVAGSAVRSVRAYVCVQVGQSAGGFLTFTGARSLFSKDNKPRAMSELLAVGCPSWFAVLSWSNQPAFTEKLFDGQSEASSTASAAASSPSSSSSDDATPLPVPSPTLGSGKRGGVCSGENGWFVVCIDLVRSSGKSVSFSDAHIFECEQIELPEESNEPETNRKGQAQKPQLFLGEVISRRVRRVSECEHDLKQSAAAAAALSDSMDQNANSEHAINSIGSTEATNVSAALATKSKPKRRVTKFVPRPVSIDEDDEDDEDDKVAKEVEEDVNDKRIENKAEDETAKREHDNGGDRGGVTVGGVSSPDDCKGDNEKDDNLLSSSPSASDAALSLEGVPVTGAMKTNDVHVDTEPPATAESQEEITVVEANTESVAAAEENKKSMTTQEVVATETIAAAASKETTPAEDNAEISTGAESQAMTTVETTSAEENAEISTGAESQAMAAVEKKTESVTTVEPQEAVTVEEKTTESIAAAASEEVVEVKEKADLVAGLTSAPEEKTTASTVGADSQATATAAEGKADEPNAAVEAQDGTTPGNQKTGSSTHVEFKDTKAVKEKPETTVKAAAHDGAGSVEAAQASSAPGISAKVSAKTDAKSTPASLATQGEEPSGKVALEKPEARGGAHSIQTDGAKTFPLDRLQVPADKLPPDVDPRAREASLSEADFVKVFGMPPSAFLALPAWKRTSEKKKHNLF